MPRTATCRRAGVLIAALCLAALAFRLPAQRVLSGDSIATGKGTLIIHPLVHASFVTSWNGKVMDFDPVGGKAVFGGMPSPDVIFITHDHPDHLNVATLRLVAKPGTRLIAPQAVFDKLPDDLQRITHIMRNGDSFSVDGIGVKAVPMYNLPPNHHHPKGRGNGYVLILGGKRIYVSGDTDNTAEVRALMNIDVAFVCMNPPYTMSVEQAADAVLAFKPHIVYPYHYRSPNGLNDVGKFKRLVEQRDKSIEVRLRNWYPAQ